LVTPGLAFIEIDFPEVTRNKAAAIECNPTLREQLADTGAGGGGAAAGADVWIDAERGAVRSPQYRLQPADLRNLDELESALERGGLDYSLPTFVLAECVLVYMQPAASGGVVQLLAQRLPTAALAVYEQVNPSDAFGRQMMVNLQSRGAPLLGIPPSLPAHAQRLKQGGWQRAEAKSMAAVYRCGVHSCAPAVCLGRCGCRAGQLQGAGTPRSAAGAAVALMCSCAPSRTWCRRRDCIDPADRRRIERLEIFDEFEEWNLFQEHYAVALAVNDASGLLKNFGFPRFQPPPPPPQFQAPALRPPQA
jgi:tRNA wybutosine-synthesizing protein 4